MMIKEYRENSEKKFTRKFNKCSNWLKSTGDIPMKAWVWQRYRWSGLEHCHLLDASKWVSERSRGRTWTDCLRKVSCWRVSVSAPSPLSTSVTLSILRVVLLPGQGKVSQANSLIRWGPCDCLFSANKWTLPYEEEHQWLVKLILMRVRISVVLVLNHEEERE